MRNGACGTEIAVYVEAEVHFPPFYFTEGRLIMVLSSDVEEILLLMRAVN